MNPCSALNLRDAVGPSLADQNLFEIKEKGKHRRKINYV